MRTGRVPAASTVRGEEVVQQGARKQLDLDRFEPDFLYPVEEVLAADPSVAVRREPFLVDPRVLASLWEDGIT